MELQDEVNAIGRLRNLANKQDAGRLIYYAAFALFLFAVVMRRIVFDSFFGIDMALAMQGVKVLVVVLLLIKVFVQDADWKRKGIALALVAVGAVVYATSAVDFLFFVFLFVAASIDVRIDTLAKVSLAVNAFLLVLAVACCLFGVIDDVAGEGHGVVRHSLGFNHPNGLGLTVFAICVAVAVICFGKNPLPPIVCDIAAFLVVMFVCNSRTSAVSIVFLAALTIFCRLLKAKPRVLVVCAMVLFGVLVVFTVVPMVFYDADACVYSALNDFLSLRFEMLHEGFTSGLTPFGQGGLVPSNMERVLPMDMSYGNLIVKSGIISAVLLTVLLPFMLLKAYKERCFNAVIFGFAALVFFGFAETATIRFAYDYFLAGIATVIYSTRISDFGPSLENIEDAKSRS